MKTAMLTSPLLSEHGIPHGFCNGEESRGFTFLRPEIGSISGLPVQFVRQRHSATVVHADKLSGLLDRPDADALVMQGNDKAVGVLTADCVPVLLADPQKNIVAAVHAGWKSAVAGIVENSLKAMLSLGANPQTIIAAIGPCIAAEHYEFGKDEHHERAIKDCPESADFFSPHPEKEEKLIFDVSGLVRQQLRSCGIRHVDDMMCDTYGDETYASARRQGLIAHNLSFIANAPLQS